MAAASLATKFHCFPCSFGFFTRFEISIYLLKGFLFLLCGDKSSNNQKCLNILPALVKNCLFSLSINTL